MRHIEIKRKEDCGCLGVLLWARGAGRVISHYQGGVFERHLLAILALLGIPTDIVYFPRGPSHRRPFVQWQVTQTVNLQPTRSHSSLHCHGTFGNNLGRCGTGAWRSKSSEKLYEAELRPPGPPAEHISLQRGFNWFASSHIVFLRSVILVGLMTKAARGKNILRHFKTFDIHIIQSAHSAPNPSINFTQWDDLTVKHN